MVEKGKGFIDGLFSSAKDALSFKNLFRRVLYFFFFGLVLSLRTLVQNIDAVGKSNGAWYLYFKALTSAIWHGVGISLSSVWQLIVDFGGYSSTHSWGSVGVGIFMTLMLVLFFFQPVSLLINLFDLKGKQETGESSGQAVGTLIRIGATVFLVLVLSALTFYASDTESILSDSHLVTINETKTVLNNSQEENNTILNSLNMLVGGDNNDDT